MKIGLRLTALVFTAFLLHAFTMNGMTVNRVSALSGHDGMTALILFDVCGHGVPFSSLDDYIDDVAVALLMPPKLVFLPLRHIPPIPEPTIALVDPRIIEQPPEAYPSS